MAKDRTMSLREHLDTADDLAIATHHLTRIFYRCQGHYGKSSRLMKLLHKLCPGVLNGIFVQIQGELDEEYHRIIDNDAFDKHGHVYYDLEARYDNLDGAQAKAATGTCVSTHAHL